jgi:small-conductance mechanosensitive channel
MERLFHYHTTQSWLIAAAIAAGVFVLAVIIRAVVIGRLARIAERTATLVDDVILQVIRRTKLLFVAIAALYAGSLALPALPELERDIVQKVTILAVFVQTAVWVNAGIAFGVQRHRERTIGSDAGAVTTMSAFGILGRIAVWIVLLLAILQNLGVEISALITGLGIGGIAVALAVQNVLGDVLASLSIVLDKPFVIGDFLIVDDMMGTVEHVGLKTTRIRSLSGEQLVVSNNDLLSSRIRNYKRMTERRVVFTFGVTYDTPAEKLLLVPAIVKEAIEAEARTRYDRCHFFRLGDSSLDFETVYFINSPDYNLYMDIQQRLNLKLFTRLQAERIGFAYPTRTIHLHPAQNGSPPADASGAQRPVIASGGDPR